MNMKRLFNRLAVLSAIAVFSSAALHAKDFDVTMSCDPEGAQVYLNGTLVSVTTPSIVKISDKVAKKMMLVRFEKEGYEPKTVTVSYDKKQLKLNPIIYCKLQKEDKPSPASVRAADDPTLTMAQKSQRVDRHSAGTTDMERTILRWFFDSDPRGARIFYRVISNAPDEVKNTNETYLTTTPLEETRSFNIQGLTYDNSRNVTVEIKVSKRGYEDQVKRYNVRQALDQQEISGFFELVPKESQGDE